MERLLKDEKFRSRHLRSRNKLLEIERDNLREVSALPVKEFLFGTCHIQRGLSLLRTTRPCKRC